METSRSGQSHKEIGTKEKSRIWIGRRVHIPTAYLHTCSNYQSGQSGKSGSQEVVKGNRQV